MEQQHRARLGGGNGVIAWLVDPTTAIPADARPILYAQLLSAPQVVVMGAFSGMAVVIAAALRTGLPHFWVLAAVDLSLLLLRLRAIARARRHFRAGTLPTIDRTICLTLAWCTLQGLSGFAIAMTGDMVLIVIATAFILGLVAPICARNYAAPRLAVTLVMVSDAPFKIGLALSGEPLLWILIALGVPLFAGVRVLLRNFSGVLAASLNAAQDNRLLAQHDALTGLANRYGLDDRLAQLTASPDRPLALLCLDLDRFKPVNDRYGHAAGDAVLVEVADRLRSVARDASVIARLGGDEFLIAARDLPPDEAGVFAERIVRAVAARSYRIEGADRISIGVSVGYACYPDDATGVAALRRRADAALYAAKRAGAVRRYDDAVMPVVDAA